MLFTCIHTLATSSSRKDQVILWHFYLFILALFAYVCVLVFLYIFTFTILLCF